MGSAPIGNPYDSFVIGGGEASEGGETCGDCRMQHQLRGNHKPPERSESYGNGPL